MAQRFINRSLRLMAEQRPSRPTRIVIHKTVYLCSSYLLTDDELNGSSLVEELCSAYQRLYFYLDNDEFAAESECPMYLHTSCRECNSWS